MECSCRNTRTSRFSEDMECSCRSTRTRSFSQVGYQDLLVIHWYWPVEDGTEESKKAVDLLVEWAIEVQTENGCVNLHVIAGGHLNFNFGAED